MDYESKDIKRVDSEKLFTNIKQPSKPKTFRPRIKKIFRSIGAFFGNIFKFFRDHRFARIALIVLIIAIPVGVWVLVKAVFPGDILIGDIRIARQDINTYANELERYKEINPSVILDDAEQTATDFLIENAAFRHFAQTDCADVDVDLSHIQHTNQNSFYLRIPAENSAYRAQLESCLIADKAIFGILINFDAVYFHSIEDVSEREAAFAAAKQRLSDEFLPLFEQGLSTEEIATRADFDPINDPLNIPSAELWFTQVVVEALLANCRGDATDCFNDEETDYGSNPGQLFTMAEKIQGLKEVGDYTDVFGSKAGTFSILRLEDKSDGLFNSFEEMLEHIKDTYVKKSFFERLFAFAAENVFVVEDAYADTFERNVSSEVLAKCSNETVRFFIRAQTTAGLDLSGWTVHITQSGNDCISPSVVDEILGPGSGPGQPLLEYVTNCMGSGPNFTGNKGSELNPNGGFVVDHPYRVGTTRYTEALYLVQRLNGDTGVDVYNPTPDHKNKVIPWTPSQINAQGMKGNGIVIMYESIPIEAVFSSQSAVSIGTGQHAIDTLASSNINGNIENGGGAFTVEPTTIDSTASGSLQVVVNFDHSMFYSGPEPYLHFNTPLCPEGITSGPVPCAHWEVKLFGDVNMLGVGGTGTTNANLMLEKSEIQPGIFHYQVYGTDTRTYTLPTPDAGTYRDYRICQRITFDIGIWTPEGSTVNFSAVSGSGSSSTACALFRVDNGGDGSVGGGPTVPGECPVPDHVAEANRGNTKARSGVINLSKDVGAWAYTSGDATNSGNNITGDNTRYVWAKPGDSIQFKHTLCFGVQAVRGSINPGSGTGGAGNGVRNLRPGTYKPTTTSPSVKGWENTFSVTASTVPASSGKYLFGKSLANPTENNYTRTLTFSGIPDKKPSNVIPDESNDYNFTFYSPSKSPAAGDTFKCNDSLRGLSDFRTNGYQIPGFRDASAAPASCGPTTTVPTSSDVGKIIQQELGWRNVTAWLTTATSPPARNKDSYGNDLGEKRCMCDEQRGVSHYNAMTYDDQTYPSGYTIGHRVFDCRQNGRCSCDCWGGACASCPYYEDRYDYWYYPLDGTNPDGPVQTVQAKIPFNYTTAPEANVKAVSGSIVFGGTDVEVSANVKIKPRSNTEISSTPYATISKPSKYEVVVFTVNSAVGKPDGNSNIQHEKSDQVGSKDKQACTYYTTNANNCQTLARDDYTFNPKGYLSSGGTDAYAHVSSDIVFNHDVTVPDLAAGTKFCVAVGVWPSDSHDDHPTGGSPANPVINPPANPVSPDGAGGIALKADSGGYWHYSEPTCRTIAKKPTAQFRSSGVFTDGPITTSQTKKHTDYTIGRRDYSSLPSGDSSLISSKVNSTHLGVRRVFGSWVEYEAIVHRNSITNGGITGFASGAAFGYNRNNGGGSGYSANATSIQPRANFFSVPYNIDPELCTYSTQTFSNSNCASSKQAGYSLIRSMGDTVLDRLISRYTLEDNVLEYTVGNPGGGVLNIAMSSAPISGYCRPESDGSFTPVFPNGVPHTNQAFTCLSNGAKYIKIQGDANLGNSSAALGESASMNIMSACVGSNEWEGVTYPDDNQNRTIVLHVTGKFTINGNIMLSQTVGSGPRGPFCGDSLTFDGIAKIPQFMIFAGDIDITWFTQYVDAWLIAGKTGTTGTGTINTCSSVPFEDLAASTFSMLQYTICGSLGGGLYRQGTLTVNGPVFANKLILNRIAGAGTGTGSIMPAEVFNLPAETYLWAYNQAQRWSQAVTTYSRELAPRF